MVDDNNENQKKKKEDDEHIKKKRLLILLLLLLLLLLLGSISVTVWAIWFRKPDTVITPDFAPQHVESHAESIGDNGESKLEQPQGGGAVSLTYSREVTIDISDKKASLLFANPSKSNQDMVLQLVIGETVVIQSGRLEPGNQVTTLDLLDGVAEKLTAGGYEGKFVVLFYQPDTGEKAMLNTEIPVTITAQD